MNPQSLRELALRQIARGVNRATGQPPGAVPTPNTKASIWKQYKRLFRVLAQLPDHFTRELIHQVQLQPYLDYYPIGPAFARLEMYFQRIQLGVTGHRTADLRLFFLTGSTVVLLAKDGNDAFAQAGARPHFSAYVHSLVTMFFWIQDNVPEFHTLRGSDGGKADDQFQYYVDSLLSLLAEFTGRQAHWPQQSQRQN